MATAQPSTGALFRALRNVNPDLAYEAEQQTHRQAGENVVTQVGSRIETLQARVDRLDAKVDRFQTQVNARFDTFQAQVDARFSRVDARIADKFEQLYRHLWSMGFGIISITATLVVGLLKLLPQ